MKPMVTFLVLAALLQVSLAASVLSTQKKMVCYYGTWAVYRPGIGKFDVENIDPNMCTHVIYAFAMLNTDSTIAAYDPWNDLYDNYGKGAYTRFTNLKKQNPALKTLLAIGGWDEGSDKYSAMAASPTLRAKFVQSVVAFLKQYNFDGLDFDWEYPGTRGGNPAIDKQNFVAVLRELKAAFTTNGFMLTSAVSQGQITMDIAYDVPTLAGIVDQIHVMAYDYHGAWETVTGLNAPLYGNDKYDVGNEFTLNVDWSVKYWISKGVSPSQIILGMPLYGRGFTLSQSSQNGFKVSAPYGIAAGPYTQQDGTWGYNEICQKLQTQSGWTVVRDSCYQAPYAYRSNQWIGYDDVQSLTLKAQYVNAMNLGGAMVWSIDTDDFLGTCGTTFPLIKTIKNNLNSAATSLPPTCGSAVTSVVSTVAPTQAQTTAASTQAQTTAAPTQAQTTKAPTTVAPTQAQTTAAPTQAQTTKAPTTGAPTQIQTTAAPIQTSTTIAPAGQTSILPGTTQSQTCIYTTTPPTTPGGTPAPSPICKKEGLNAFADDCATFFQCENYGFTDGAWVVYTQTCAKGTVFSESLGVCVYPNMVKGCENYYIK